MDLAFLTSLTAFTICSQRNTLDSEQQGVINLSPPVPTFQTNRSSFPAVWVVFTSAQAVRISACASFLRNVYLLGVSTPGAVDDICALDSADDDLNKPLDRISKETGTSWCPIRLETHCRGCYCHTNDSLQIIYLWQLGWCH